ncbi:MAG: hypothetical protein QXE16_03250 [Candidatus Bathyarchaeia archaeon]
MKRASLKPALLAGSLAAALTLFMITLYYLHLVDLVETPIERMRYTATIYASAIAFFTLSLSMNLVALLTHRESKSSRLMAVSAIAALIGYIFPCERLLRFSYTGALYETVMIAVVHILLLTLSAMLLKKAKARL